MASKVRVDPVTGMVEGIEYQRYADPDSPRHTTGVARGRLYVLAAHAVENAKVLLASGLGGDRSLIGKGLIDHPALYAWGLSPVPVGAYRGPLSTAGIEDLRGGAFRAPACRVPVRHRQRRLAGHHGRPRFRVLDAVTTGPVRHAGCAATSPRRCRGTSASPWRSSSCARRRTRSPSIPATSTRSATRAR